MFGDPFFTVMKDNHIDNPGNLQFSSPCLGILFSLEMITNMEFVNFVEFSSPCLGILFSQAVCNCKRKYRQVVFVPMFGDSFFT